MVQWNWSSAVTGCTWVTCIPWRQRTNFTAPSCKCTCESTQVKIYTGLIASTDFWPQEMFTFFGNACTGRVWKQFRCLRLSMEACGASPRLALLSGVILVTMRGWADVGLWVAVWFLAKISLHRPTCKATFARLTQSQAISKSLRVLITFRSMRGTTFFSFFETLFDKKITVSFTMVIKDLLVENLQVAGGQLRNPPVQFRRDLWPHLAIDQHAVCPNLSPE